MSEKGLLVIIVAELALLLFGLYTAAQKAQAAAAQVANNPLANILSNL